MFPYDHTGWKHLIDRRLIDGPSMEEDLKGNSFDQQHGLSPEAR